MRRARRIDAVIEGAGHDVILVGGDHQALHGQAHAHRRLAREDIAEISGGDDESGGTAQRGCRREVIDRLRRDADKVDRVDGGEADLVGKVSLCKQTLHQRLGIVETAFQRDVVDIGVGAGGHLAALHIADPALGMQDKDFDIFQPAQRGDGGGAGVARRGRHDGGLAAARFQGAGEEAAQYLKRDILEGKGGAVEQLQQMGVLADFRQRHDGARARFILLPVGRRLGRFKTGIGGFDIGFQLGGAEGIAHKAAENFKGDMLVGLAGEGGDFVTGKLRPGGRHIQAAIGRQARQQHLREIGARSLAAGGNEMRCVGHEACFRGEVAPWRYDRRNRRR